MKSYLELLDANRGYQTFRKVLNARRRYLAEVNAHGPPPSKRRQHPRRERRPPEKPR